MDPNQLATRLAALLGDRPRVVLGIAGAPGAGKSTLAAEVVAAADADGIPSVWVPMDGYHLADVELDRLGRRARKGSIDTFDGAGYLALLRRLRTDARTVYAPAFDRDIEQPIAGSISIPPEARLIVTEGNYLLDDRAPWDEVRAELDAAWFVAVDDDTRRRRLVRRHIRFGKSPDDAAAWVDTVDEPNAVRILRARDRADLVVELEAEAALASDPPATLPITHDPGVLR